MARIKNYGVDDFLHSLTSMDVGALTTEMIEAAEPVMVERVKKYANRHKASGDMIRSIKSTGVKERRGGKYLVVRPTGRDHKGVRNMEKLAYLEYGTANMPASPIITPAVKDAEQAIEWVWNDIMERWCQKNGTMSGTLNRDSAVFL